MAERDVFVRKIYTYNNIAVAVEVDYAKGTVSVVEKLQNGTYAPKKWVFCDRQLEYMQGWLNILEAIQFAVGEATKLLEAEDEAKAKDLYQLLALLDKSATPEKKGKA
jgi:hypothetical protein